MDRVLAKRIAPLNTSLPLQLRDRRAGRRSEGTEWAQGLPYWSRPVTFSMARDLRIARRAEHRVALWTICLLSACLVLEAGTLASTFSHRAELRAAASAPPLPGEAAPNDAPRRTIVNLRLAALVGTGIIWLVWLRRAYRNLALVGSKRSRFTTRQAVGYWFIPLVNLVRAYQVMKDLWLRSESMNDRDAYDDLPAPPLLSGWWGMSLAWGLLEPVVAATARNARTALELTNVTDVALVGSVVGIVAMVLAIRVVRGIDQRQQCFSANPPDLPAPSAAARHHGTQAPRSVPPSDRPIVRAPPDQKERRV